MNHKILSQYRGGWYGARMVATTSAAAAAAAAAAEEEEKFSTLD